MEDKEIIALYRQRSQEAIKQTLNKYGRGMYEVANHVLNDPATADECVNDACLAVWDAIPPAEPESLAAFSKKITRNIAIGRLRFETREKRGGSQAPVQFSELEETLADAGGIDRELERSELAGAINSFLAGLKESERRVFVRRYFYFDEVRDIAGRYGFGLSKTKMMLARTRQKLADYLKEEGLL